LEVDGGGCHVTVAFFRSGEVVFDSDGTEAKQTFRSDEDGVGSKGKVIVVYF
jgi:hypothetical protein